MRLKLDRGHTAAYLVLALMVFFNLLPFFWMVSTSLKTEAESYAIPPTYWPQTITFTAYEQVVQWSNFPRQFFNSTVISLATAVFSTFLGALAGYGFSRYHFVGKTTLIGLVLATQMLPGVLLVGPYFRIMSSIGLHNTYAGLILAFTTITLPFSIWMLKGFTDTVPRELDEAAMVDGCTPLGAYMRVILPLLAPGMVATVVFAFLLSWGDLLWALIMTSGEDMSVLTLGLTRLVTQFRIVWPQLMAGSLIAIVPCMVLYIALQNYLVRGLTAGAVKE